MPVKSEIRHFVSGAFIAFSICCAVAQAETVSPPEIDSSWTWIETPFGKPVIDRGRAGDWNHAAVDNPYVYVEGGRYYCFFEAQDTKRAGWHERIGLAVSPDGVTWSKSTDNPMLEVGPAGAWDGVVAKLPAGVVKRNGTYHLFYSGRDHASTKQTNKCIGLATARSLTGPWRKYTGNPVLSGRGNRWDRHVTTLPVAVFQHGENYWMLFRGMKGFYHDQGLGAATSDDLLNWKRGPRSDERPLIRADQEIASIAVAGAGGKYVGISQPLKLADRRYWYSNDLVTWKKGPPVKFKASVQAETLSNPFLVDGKWNVLYEQGDRIFRAVLTSSNAPVASSPHAGDDKPRVVFNDDAQMLGEAPPEGTSEFVKAWLDKEAEAVPFSTYVFLAAMPDLCTFDSKVGETYGDRFGAGYSKGWAPGIRGLRAEGTDALKLVADHMHAKGKEVLAAIRMSDTHHKSLSPSNPLCPKFAIEHPQFVIKQPDGRTNETALDYSHTEVRNHRLDIMREIVNEYDVDGLELNFVRWAKHFPRDKGREKAMVMTSYVSRIRETLTAAAKQRGRDRLTLGVRVPESIAACWLAGVDIETWVRRGWIDYIVISTWNNTDPQLRVDEFTRFTKPAGVDTIVVMGNMIGSLDSGPPSVLDRPDAMSAKHKTTSYLGMLITESEARGAAANYYTWGADSISFWNVGIHFGNEVTATPEQQQRIARWTQAVRSKESVFAGPRTYRYLPMGKGISSRKPPVRNYPWYDEGRSPLGHVNSPVLKFDEAHAGKRLVFPFRMADGRDGEKLSGRLTFWVYHLTDKDEMAVDINGQYVDRAKIKRFPVGKRRGGLPGQRFEISLTDCPPFRGDNELGLTLKSPVDREQSPHMEELEIVARSK